MALKCGHCGATISARAMHLELARLMNKRRKVFHRHNADDARRFGAMGAAKRWGKKSTKQTASAKA